MSNDRVVERIYISGIFKFLSPVIIGSGLNNETDQDFLLNGDGIPFIPGTSIAGILRSSLANEEHGQEEEDIIQRLFGKKGNENREADSSQLSRLYVYDAYLLDEQSYSMSVRDGIRIREQTKVVKEGSKFDYQVLEPGCEFQIRFEVIIRQGDDELALKDALFEMIDKLIKGSVRFGAKTNRGFGYGKLKRQSIKILDLSLAGNNVKAAFNEWLEFNWNSFSSNTNIEEWVSFRKRAKQDDWITFIVPFALQSSILIRQYTNKADSPDYHHLMSNNEAIIPGTTWNGVIRHQVYRILKELGKDKKHISEMINNLFGFVDEKMNDAKASRIRFYETRMEGGQNIKQTRVKIDRFTGGAATSALFDCVPYFKGNTQLKIEIKKPEKYEIGILLLVLKDLQEGYVAVGGETSIGRGMLTGEHIFYIKDDEKREVDSEFIEEHYNALADHLIGGRREEVYR